MGRKGCVAIGYEDVIGRKDIAEGLRVVPVVELEMGIVRFGGDVVLATRFPVMERGEKDGVLSLMLPPTDDCPTSMTVPP